MAEFPSSTAARLRRLHAQALRPALQPLGFVHEKPSTWVRTHGPLRHVLVLGARHGSHQLEALIQDLDTGPVVWGDTDDRSMPGIVLLRPSIEKPMTLVRIGSITDDDALTTVARALAVEAAQYEEALRPLISRRVLCDYLLVNQGAEAERDSRFMEPAWWGLKVVVAAAMAVLDGDPRADGLVTAVDTFADSQPRWNEAARLRRDRLHALVSDPIPFGARAAEPQ